MRRGYIQTGIGQLHVVEAGHGPALLLIPHSGRSSRMYADLIKVLSADFRVVVLDVPGTGASVPLPSRDVTVAEIADCFIEALDQLDLRSVDIFGLHGGNKIGSSIVARYPERVRKFVFAGQSHSIIANMARRDEVFRKTPSIQAGMADAGVNPPRFWASQFSEISALWWDGAHIEAIGDPDFRHRLVERVIDSLQSFQDRPAFYRAAFAYDMEHDLSRISVPTLILELTTPKEDREIGRQGPALLEIVKGARLVTLESPDVYAVTLEDRVPEVADILRSFFAPGTSGAASS